MNSTETVKMMRKFNYSAYLLNFNIDKIILVWRVFANERIWQNKASSRETRYWSL